MELEEFKRQVVGVLQANLSYELAEKLAQELNIKLLQKKMYTVTFTVIDEDPEYYLRQAIYEMIKNDPSIGFVHLSPVEP